ncbi:MAG: SusC/RagA family TonB-linked outer membrane protein [Tannerellaceae bacterium]|nr:SusC/RagA family TonB-linked outer membrane protein [Tannerellaceae bacterium]
MLNKFKPISLILLAGACSFSGNLHAEIAPVKPNVSISQQNRKVTGTVEDFMGPVVGASVVVKGTTNGTITDLNGNFSLDSVTNGSVIQISFIGYITQEIAYTGQPSLFVNLEEDAKALDEVVVTALGLKRETKALGYAVTELKGDDLRTNQINPVASLQGKVAGVEISGSDGGMFGSTKIQIRGASTLGNNNQPIYVVDGIILDNDISDAGDADWDSSANDFGNALKNLNPDDFETVSVLKGAAATALYGSRGLNGAVVITTKSGKAGQGLGINVSQTFGIDHVFATPSMQNVFGPGQYSGNVSYGQVDANGAYYSFDNANQFYLTASGQAIIPGPGQADAYFRHWGPRYDDRSILNYIGDETTYSPYKNNYKDAYNLGFNSNTNVSIQGGNDKTTFYTSLSYKYASGTLPNNKFERLSMMAKASHKITDKVQLEASVAFANSTPKNPQPNIGDNFSQGYWGRSYNTKYWKTRYKGEHGGNASNDYADTYGNVPYTSTWFSIYENSNVQKETNVRPTLTLHVDLLDWLKFRAEGNYNYYYVRGEQKELGQGYANTNSGSYKLTQSTKEQTNLNANLTANKTFGDWNVGGFVRGEYFNSMTQYQEAETQNGLVVPGQYFLDNSRNTPKTEAKIEATKRMFSVAFQASVSWRNQVFVDVTGRNDWSSALVYTNGTGNFSYFYPSVSGSWLLNETFELPEWISLGKVRASWAQVGNDTEAYKINQGYTLNSMQRSTGYIYGLEVPKQVYDPNIKPERKNAWEVGIDWRFLQNRIHLDATYYKENTKNQIMEISVPSVSGINSQLINAGNIQNKGVEIALNTIPFKNKDWEWGLDFTYTKNSNKIIELHPNVADYILLDGYTDYGNYRIGSVAKVGGSYGMLMSQYAPKKDEQGRTVLVWTDTYRGAYPDQALEDEIIGKITPDFLGSIATSLTWKDLSLRVALDMRYGGYVAMYGSRYATAYGISETSLKWRDTEYGGMTWTSKYDGVTYTDGMIPDGVFAEGQTVLGPNGESFNVGGMTYQEAYEASYVEPVHASVYHYWSNAWSSGTVNDNWFAKLNYIALREVSLSYRMPRSIYSKIGAKHFNVTLTGHNLGYLYNSLPNNENPESVRGTGSSAFRMRSFSPYTASYMLILNFGF